MPSLVTDDIPGAKPRTIPYRRNFNPLKNYGEGVLDLVKPKLGQNKKEFNQPFNKNNSYQNDSLDQYISQNKNTPLKRQQKRNFQQNALQFFRGSTPTRESVMNYKNCKGRIQKSLHPRSNQLDLKSMVRDPNFAKNLYKFYGVQENYSPYYEEEGNYQHTNQNEQKFKINKGYKQQQAFKGKNENSFQQNVKQFFRGTTPTRESYNKYRDEKNRVQRSRIARRKEISDLKKMYKQPKFIKNLYKFYVGQQQEYTPSMSINKKQESSRNNNRKLQSRQYIQKKPFLLLEYKMPIHKILSQLNEVNILTIPQNFNSQIYQRMMALFRIRPEQQEIWILLNGKQGQKNLFEYIKRRALKLRAISFLNNKLQFIS